MTACDDDDDLQAENNELRRENAELKRRNAELEQARDTSKSVLRSWLAGGAKPNRYMKAAGGETVKVSFSAIDRVTNRWQWKPFGHTGDKESFDLLLLCGQNEVDVKDQAPNCRYFLVPRDDVEALTTGNGLKITLSTTFLRRNGRSRIERKNQKLRSCMKTLQELDALMASD